MKFIVKNHITKQPQRIISVIVLTGILSLSTGLTMLQSATAAPRSQQAAVNVPKAVADAVLQAASRRSRLPISNLRIIQAERRTWSNGCLGLARPDEFCTLALVPGWLVSVQAKQRLVYRTNASGSQVRLDEAASQIGDAGTIKPLAIPKSELPPPLKAGEVFRAITSGGIAGLTYETTLLNDGRLIRVQVNFNGTTSQTQTYQISRQQVQQFQQVLEQQQFARFNGLSYPAPSGAADYFTVTFTSRAGTTRYTDINQDSLPRSLQAVIQAWNQLLGSTKA